jgi:hypothetical protein
MDLFNVPSIRFGLRYSPIIPKVTTSWHIVMWSIRMAGSTGPGNSTYQPWFPSFTAMKGKLSLTMASLHELFLISLHLALPDAARLSLGYPER